MDLSGEGIQLTGAERDDALQLDGELELTRLAVIDDDLGALHGSAHMVGTLEGALDENVQRALDSLPPDYRMAVVLADLEGFSYREIADILEVPIGTVMSRLYRGRKMLQGLLHGYAVEQGIIPAASGDGEARTAVSRVGCGRRATLRSPPRGVMAKCVMPTPAASRR